MPKTLNDSRDDLMDEKFIRDLLETILELLETHDKRTVQGKA